MLQYLSKFINRRDNETGASAVEYGLLVALIAAVIVVIVLSLGGVVKGAFKKTCDGIVSGGAVSSSCTDS